MDKTIITNNSKVFKKFKNKYEVIFLRDAGYMDVLYKARSKVQSGCKLLTHPMSGSLKPNQTPFKSVVLAQSTGTTDYESVILIENSIEDAVKFFKFKNTPAWNEKTLDDFRIVDLSLIENVIKTPMFKII